MWFGGGDGQRINTGIATNPTDWTLVAHVLPDAAQSAEGAALWSKSSYYATATSDFPVDLLLDTSLVPKVQISNNADYSPDLSVTADGALLSKRWNFVAASWNNAAGVLTLCTNGTFKTASGSVSISANSRNWTFGNSALDNDAGTNRRKYWGWAWRPRVFRVCKTQAEIQRLMAGYMDRTGLLWDLLSYDDPSRPLRPLRAVGNYVR